MLFNIDDYYYDTNKTVSKYRYDKIDRLKVDNVCRMVRKGEAEIKTFQYNCIKTYQGKTLVNELGGDSEFIDIINDVIKSDKGCLVTGITGTGKTYFANMLVSELEKQGKKVGVKLAPTNKAASHIKGQTIHKYFMTLMLSQNYENKLLKN